MGKKFASRAKAEKATEEEQLRDQLLRWRKDAVLFFEEALGVKLTNYQKSACHLFRAMIVAKMRLADNKPVSEKKVKHFGCIRSYSEMGLAKSLGLSIHSGKGLGKDFLIAGLSAYSLLLYSDFKGLATAPTAKQLDDVYASEVRRMLRDSPANLLDFFDVIKGGIYLKEGTQRTESFITKRTATIKGNAEEQAETLQGMHSSNMIFFIDEASGLPDGCFKALEETLTGRVNFAVLITNMTRNTGYAYRSHYDPKETEHWVCMRWDAEECDLDEVTGHKGLSTQIERMEKKYGRDSNPFRIAVKGLPPKAEDDALLNLEWVEAARNRWEEVEADPDVDPVIFGVDVGRGNDDSAIGKRIGIKFSCKAKSTSDTMRLADWLDEEMEMLTPDQTIIDSSGVGGAFCDAFRRIYNRSFVQLDVSEGASRNKRYFRLRDELWMKVKEAFETGSIAIDPEDEELFFELLSIKVENNWQHPIKIISKKKLKSMGIPSPNRADSLMHTYYFRGSTSKRQKRELDAYEREALRQESHAGDWMTA